MCARNLLCRFGSLYVLGSSQDSDRPGPKETHGVFTASLLKRLQEEGHSVDVRRLLARVQYDVRAATPKQVPRMSFLMRAGEEVFILPQSAELPVPAPVSTRDNLKVPKACHLCDECACGDTHAS